MTIAGIILLIGRILFAALFASSAKNHISGHDRYVAMASGKMPLPFIAGWPVGLYLLVAQISVVVGIWPEIGALMLALFVLVAAVLFHRFWNFTDPMMRRTQQSNFYRNISLLGAALALFVFFSTTGQMQFAVTGPFITLQ